MYDIFMNYLPAWMFVALFALLLLGYPVAFTIGSLAFFFGWLGFGLNFFNLVPIRVWGVMTNFTLTAVPLFIFMGITLERSGLAEDLLDTMAVLFGRLRGGLSISVIIVGALLAASTGIVGATTVTMGLLALPPMLRRKYSREVATGTIAASGTLGQIIPPSIVLVVLADIMNISVGDLFVGAILPGFVLVSLYLTVILTLGWLRPDMVPAVPPEELASITRPELIRRVLKTLVPPLLLIVAVLGSIFFGIAAPTEAAAVGAAAAQVLVFWHRRWSLKMLRGVMQSTVRLTSMVFIILVGAQIFGLVFRGLGGDELIREFLSGLEVGPYGVLAMTMVTLFIAGFFLDFIEITFIHVPVLGPLMVSYGFDPVWVSVLMAVNLQTSFLTPPFGYSLFYLKSVSPPEVSTADIYRGIIPFVLLQLVGLAIIILFPQLVLWLPDVVFGGGYN